MVVVVVVVVVAVVEVLGPGPKIRLPKAQIGARA